MSGRTNRQEFKGRVRSWAERLEVPIDTVTIRPMVTKWASCSTAGNLTFNEELLELEEDVRDYVIVHELLHFHAPNHGRLWKSLMHAHLGDYEELDRRLRRHHAGQLSRVHRS